MPRTAKVDMKSRNNKYSSDYVTWNNERHMNNWMAKCQRNGTKIIGEEWIDGSVDWSFEKMSTPRKSAALICRGSKGKFLYIGDDNRLKNELVKLHEAGELQLTSSEDHSMFPDKDEPKFTSKSTMTYDKGIDFMLSTTNGSQVNLAVTIWEGEMVHGRRTKKRSTFVFEKISDKILAIKAIAEKLDAMVLSMAEAIREEEIELEEERKVRAIYDKLLFG